MQGKKILLFGLGFFQRGLLKSLSKTRGCIVVDADGKLLERFKDEVEDLHTIEGEASSIVTWKKIPIGDISHIVSSVQDTDVVLEVCRIVRDFYKLDIPIIIIWYKDENRMEFEKYRVKLLNPLEIGVEAVMGLIDKNYTKPTNIGLGQGEIVEVSILRRSHIVDRKMRYLQPSRWKVAAAFREGRLIVPDGDFRLQIGDRAILIGDPKVIENIVNILMKGTPEFPLQYGQTFVVLADTVNKKDVFEIQSYRSKTRVRKYMVYDVEGNKKPKVEALALLDDDGFKKGEPLKNFRSALYLKDVGLIAISGVERFSIFDIRMRYLFKRIKSPLIICRGGFPYSEVIISLNGHIPDRLIEVGYEIASLFEVPFSIVYTAALGALKTAADDKAVKIRQNLITDFENLNRSKVNFRLLEGNPVEETLKVINERRDILLVVAADSNDPISVLSPHVSYLLAARSCVSVLVIPDEETNE